MAVSEQQRIKAAATRWKRRPKRSRRLEAVKAPADVEARYSLALRQQARGFSKQTQRALEPLLRSLEKSQREDARDDGFKSTIQRLRRQLRADPQPSRRAVKQTGVHNTEAMNKMIGPVTGGIPVWRGTTAKDQRILSKAVTENVRLIETIPKKLLDDVEKVLRHSLEKGSRVETIRARLQERYAISERQADLIARDQVLKLNSQLVEQRSSEQGIRGYTWRTSNDERVREMHEDLEGTEHTWDDPPVTNPQGDRNHPGGDYQCRCSSEANIEGFLDELGI